MAYGGVTALGLPDDLPVWVDAHVMERERVILGGGNRTSKLLLDPAQLRTVPLLEVAELAQPR